jgi:hypothetical protein
VRFKSLRPSPGALIAMIALVFAFTGAAVAANKVQTNEIAKKAVTGPKIAKDAVKGGKIADGKVKAKDLADGVLPDFAHGRVNKNGGAVSVAAGAVGITGVADGGAGVVCYDLASAPSTGTATVVHQPGNQPGSTVELAISPNAGCPAPFNDALSATKTSTTGDPVDEDLYVQFVG